MPLSGMKGSELGLAVPATYLPTTPAAATTGIQFALPYATVNQPVGRAPWVEILEEPKQRGLRFRYKCEGRSAGSILGEGSTSQRKSFPRIRINNFDGNAAIVVVSCVTHDGVPYSPHPHSLVGNDCKDGVCTVKLKGINTVTFTNIGIQCCKRQEVTKCLSVRENMRVNPFGSAPVADASKIDLSTVRLCFQAFLPDAHGKFTRIVPPVVSQPIVDKKSVHDLVICRLSRQSGYAVGGDEVFLLCEKINKDDIQVRFFEESEDGISWEAFGEFLAQDVHHQYAIVFQTPAYKDVQISSSVQVYIQLRRPSDDDHSDPKPFQYIPVDPDPYMIQGKRRRLASDVIDITHSGCTTIPTSVVPLDVKDDFDESSGSSLKQNLKTKLERRISKKEKMSSPSSAAAAAVPRYSLDFPWTPDGATAAASQFMTSHSNLVLGDDGRLYAMPGIRHQLMTPPSSQPAAQIYDLSSSRFASAVEAAAAPTSGSGSVSVSDVIAAASSVVEDVVKSPC